MSMRDTSIKDFTYPLPENRIALHPLEQRDASKLLILKNGILSEDRFAHIAKHLPQNALLVFNNTKVIHARLEFFKTSGARIEIFCLEPVGQISEYATVMASPECSSWKCLVGGAAKWKNEHLEKEVLVSGEKIKLTARKVSCEGDTYTIELSWSPTCFSFAEIIEAAGKVPLPPYIKRDTVIEDHSRYQTIFARYEGSVAAPTAGLHFSEAVFEELQKKNIQKGFVTLHVGAGTFKPVKAATMDGHEMHAEYIDVDIATIENLADNDWIAATGTTSLRTIETLYWLGVKTYLNPAIEALGLSQWEVYEVLAEKNISKKDALGALVGWMKANNKKHIFTKTQLLILPGYQFKVARILITNFHQPQSTLLLLVAAATGNRWKEMYDYALQNDFRFLSYGDSNLIFISS